MGYVAPQVLEFLGEGDESYFRFDDLYIFVIGILFVLVVAYLFLDFLFLVFQGRVSGFS